VSVGSGMDAAGSVGGNHADLQEEVSYFSVCAVFACIGFDCIGLVVVVMIMVMVCRIEIKSSMLIHLPNIMLISTTCP
jgi:hypothetical protein